ncbi:MAG: hypothetical protein ACYTFA_16230 [Planctomycetota bacterium]|jgi:hypothetical protein
MMRFVALIGESSGGNAIVMAQQSAEESLAADAADLRRWIVKGAPAVAPPLAKLTIPPAWARARFPTLSELWLTSSTGVTKMRPKIVLYMLNMLHM